MQSVSGLQSFETQLHTAQAQENLLVFGNPVRIRNSFIPAVRATNEVITTGVFSPGRDF